MQINSLQKVTTRAAKRVGRGIGSGKGKTSGRGMKGQKSRGKIPAANVGAGLIYFKKLPYRRGWGNTKVSPKLALVKIENLNVFAAGSVVTVASLLEHKVINETSAKKGVKIVNGGALTVKNLRVELPVTQSAKSAIESSGGKVV
jgi:large subunit ribosomal protein L15